MNLAQAVLAGAERHGDALALVSEERSLTYREYVHESDRLAAGLLHLGVERGDRVMIFADNSIEHLVSYLACARLGAIFVPIHESFQFNELRYVLANAQPTAIITQTRLWHQLNRHSDQLPSILISLDTPHHSLIAYSDLIRNSHESVGLSVTADHDAVLICYTSGTTDLPNPVARSHKHEIWNTTQYAKALDYRPGDRALVALPLPWVWGLSTLSLALLSVGATVVLHREFSAKQALEEIEKSRITLFAGTMSMYTAILAVLDEHKHDLSSLRHMYRGGEPLNVQIGKALEAHTGMTLLESYATTEVSPVLVVSPNRDPQPPRGSAGRPIPGVKIRIVDDQGLDLPVGEVGEAVLAGEGVMLGYWREPELTKRRFTEDGWFRTGDLLYYDDAGYYYVVGRSTDVIIRDGAKISPAEIESALSSIPGIRDSVVVGVPDEEFGESISAFVLLAPGAVIGVDDVYDHLSTRIARFKQPSFIDFVDKLPVRRNAKRDRGSFRERALNMKELNLPRLSKGTRSNHLRAVE